MTSLAVSKVYLGLPLAFIFAACAPTVGPLGPDARPLQTNRGSQPRFLQTGACEWRGAAYRCPDVPVTIRVGREADADALMWKNCPSGFVVQQ